MQQMSEVASNTPRNTRQSTAMASAATPDRLVREGDQGQFQSNLPVATEQTSSRTNMTKGYTQRLLLMSACGEAGWTP